jgi:hypothetical protein
MERKYATGMKIIMNPIILVFSLNCNKKPITQINSQIRIVKSLAEPSPIPLMPYPIILEMITKSPVITFTTIYIDLFNMLPLTTRSLLFY